MIAVLPCIYGSLSVDALSEAQMVCVCVCVVVGVWAGGSQQMGRICNNWLCFSGEDRKPARVDYRQRLNEIRMCHVVSVERRLDILEPFCL